MADQKQLSVLEIKKAPEKEGYLSDGGGLYIQSKRRAAQKPDDKPRKPADDWTRSWVFRYRDRVVKRNGVGVLRELGIGPLSDVPPTEARERAASFRLMLRNDQDPKQARTAARQQAQLDAAKAMTFDQCVESFIADRRAGWSNPKHAAQWESTLATYASPTLGKLLVRDIDAGLVMKALRPIWTTKNETASRVRGRVESVLSWAAVHGYCVGPNPARWKGHLDQMLPKPSSVQTVEHHAALPHREVGKFIADLRTQGSIGAKALEFLVLCAARTGEVIGAERREFDFDEMLWTIPAARMKMKKDHVVPLSARAAEIAKGLLDAHGGNFVFPGLKERKPLSNMAMLALLKRMERSDLTAHGFRSTFRDWASERAFPRDLAERALAHAVADKVEASYHRTQLIEQRRPMMESWAAYCAIVTPDNVRGIREAA
jgi:integrase